MPFGITATLGLDGRGFKAGMREAQGITNKWAVGLKGQIAGTFTAAALVRATKDVVKFASEVDDVSKKINFSRKAVQEWMYALKLSGVEIGDLERVVKALSATRSDVLGGKGNAEKEGILKLLGISREDLQKNPLEVTMKQIARAFETMDFGAGEGDMITKILGKGGMEMLAAFKEGIDDAIGDLNEMGAVLEDDVVRNLDQAGDAADILKTKLRAAASDGLSYLVKGVLWLNDEIKDLTDSFFAMHYGMQAKEQMGGNWVTHMRNIRGEMDAHNAEKELARVDRAKKRGAGRDKQDPWVPPKDVKEVKEAAGVTPSSDSLARIGGFVGGGGGTVNRLTAIEKELQKLNAQVKSGLVLKEQ